MYIKERRSSLLIKKASAIEFVMMVCILLAAMDFIHRYYFCVYIGFIAFLAVPGRRLKVDTSFVILMILGASMLIFDKASFVNFLAAFKPFVFPLCYIWGRSYMSKDSSYEDDCKKLNTIALMLSVGCFIHFALNYITNQGAEDRNTIDFWTGAIMSATGQATIACITIGVAVAYLFSEVNWKKKTYAVASLVLVMLYNLVLSGRTIIVFTLITVAVAYLFRMFVAKKGRFRTIIMLAVACLFLLWLYNQNIFGVKDVFEDSLLYDRFFGNESTTGFGEDSRSSAKAYYLRHMFDYPFGGDHLHKTYGGFAHDLYFDTHDSGGLFAFFSVCIYSLITIGRAFQIAKCPVVDFNTKQLIVCLYVILHMMFWTEPILAGVPWTFASFCLLDGFAASILDKYRSEMRVESKYIKKRKGKAELTVSKKAKAKTI